MKSTLTFLLSLLFSTLMFSSPSYGEWTKAAKNISDRNFYVDLERIRKVDGYGYWWELQVSFKRDEDGDLSYKFYRNFFVLFLKTR